MRPRHGDVDKVRHKIFIAGRWHKYPAEQIRVGPALLKLLGLAFRELKPARQKIEERFGVSKANLHGFLNKAGHRVQWATILRICVRTNLLASELAFDENPDLAKVDEWLRNVKWRRSGSSLKEELGEETWTRLRYQAMEKVGSAEPHLPSHDDSRLLLENIHQLIVTNQLQSPLDLWKLAARYDAKASSVQKAVDGLVGIGVLTKSGNSYCVATVGADQGREIMHIRLLLETWLIEEYFAAKPARRRAILQEMRDANDSMSVDLRQGDVGAFVANDIRFHLGLAMGKRLTKEVLDILLRLVRCNGAPLAGRSGPANRDTIAEHNAILEAMGSKGALPEPAKAAMAAHLEAAERRFFSPMAHSADSRR
jgi:DNA-binding GntR family transcriptional regulator